MTPVRETVLAENDVSEVVREASLADIFLSYVAVAADLFQLTKPRIMVLLLISTVCPMFLAAGGRLDLWGAGWALLGGALVSGSASALNCIWEIDIDAVMERTKNRPLPAGRLSRKTALLFSISIGLLGLFILAYLFNPLAALVALFGHFFYVVIYTIWLKRTTPQNIVIGGAAGAVPPVVGWVAVTGRIDITAILLFLIVFLWTPPHFWALALNKNSDYQKAGIPMLPVVAGEKKTCNLMLFYALLLIPATLSLVLTNSNLGPYSLVTLLSLSLIFSFKVYQLRSLVFADAENKYRKAWDVFGFSLLYLALFFVSLVVDSTLL